MRNHAQAGLSFAPLTPDRWRDVVQLFGSRGACGGCWCMAWRLPKQRYEAGKGNGNRRRFRALVSADGHDDHCPPGVLAYREEGSDARVPIGWCAVAPREAYVRLESARALKRLDAKPVWSISCLFVARSYRHRGVSVALLEAAADFARSHGAQIVEGYPVEPRTDTMPDVFAWTGTAAAFLAAGFNEAGRGSRSRPIMRRQL